MEIKQTLRDEGTEHSGLSMKRTDAVTNRARILEVALSVFAEHGLDMEMGEIAARAELGVGTLYRHFANREDLLRAILVHTFDDALAQFGTAIVSALADPRAELRAFVSVGLHVQQQYGPIFAVIRDPRLKEIFDRTQAQAFCDQFLEIALRMLENGVRAKLFRSDLDLEIVAATIMGSIMGVRDLFETRWSIEELAQKLSSLHLSMLAVQEERTS